jgi:beta-glucanase (GH16 family)
LKLACGIILKKFAKYFLVSLFMKISRFQIFIFSLLFFALPKNLFSQNKSPRGFKNLNLYREFVAKSSRVFNPHGTTAKIRYSLSRKYTDSLVLPKSYSQSKLVFHDAFDSFNSNTWGVGQPWGVYHPSFPHQYYGDSEVFVKNGYLYLLNQSRKKTFNSNTKDSITIPYGTGLINTFKSNSFQYGYFAIRCKNPQGAATWPAFWLTGRYHWPPEIDIFEMYGKKDGSTVHKQMITLHLGETENKSKRQFERGFKLPSNTDTSFHIYSCDWNDKRIRFYTDGVYVKSFRLTAWMKQYFQEPMYLIVNNALDHRYLEYLPKGKFSQAFVVDWVKVYQNPKQILIPSSKE